jgi:hypothetical protein
VLAVGGTTVGLLLASSALRLIASLGSPQLPRVGDAALDSRSLLFAALFTALTTIVIAILPALRARTLGLALRGSAQRTGVSPAHPRHATRPLGARALRSKRPRHQDCRRTAMLRYPWDAMLAIAIWILLFGAALSVARRRVRVIEQREQPSTTSHLDVIR